MRIRIGLSRHRGLNSQDDECTEHLRRPTSDETDVSPEGQANWPPGEPHAELPDVLPPLNLTRSHAGPADYLRFHSDGPTRQFGNQRIVKKRPEMQILDWTKACFQLTTGGGKQVCNEPSSFIRLGSAKFVSLPFDAPDSVD